MQTTRREGRVNSATITLPFDEVRFLLAQDTVSQPLHAAKQGPVSNFLNHWVNSAETPLPRRPNNCKRQGRRIILQEMASEEMKRCSSLQRPHLLQESLL